MTAMFSSHKLLNSRSVKQKVTVEAGLPDEIHDFLLHPDWLAAYSAASEFFTKHLK